MLKSFETAPFKLACLRVKTYGLFSELFAMEDEGIEQRVELIG
jgi:hypothetical protein